MSKTCYGHNSPNAVFLPNYGPCNPGWGGIDLCCEIGQTCLTKGLCVTPSGIYYNGGCTDRTYEAAICPKFCATGNANWVVQCPAGTAVVEGDFCCSENGTMHTCCNTAGNGLGLAGAAPSAQAVSATFVGAYTVPANTSSATTVSGSKNSTNSLPSIPLPTASAVPEASSTIKNRVVLGIGLGLIVGVAISAIIWLIWFLVKRIRIIAIIRREFKGLIAHCRARRRARACDRRQAEANNIPMTNLRERRNKSSSQVASREGSFPTEVEGSTAGPFEMEANRTNVTTTSPLPSIALNDNPPREPSTVPGSWYDANLGSL